MAAGFVQQLQNSTGSATSFSTTIAATGVNNLLVIACKWSNGSVTNTSITDDKGNTYVASGNGTSFHSGGNQFRQFYGVQTVSGATSITAHWTTSTSCRIDIMEFSGMAATNALVFDKSATPVTGSGGTSTSASVSLSPSASGKLIVSQIGFATSTSAWSSTNYTVETNTNATQVGAYRLSGTTSETAPYSWTSGADFCEFATSFNLPPVSVGSGNASMMGVG